MSKEKDKSKDKVVDNHTGSTAAEDPELSLWLNRLWARNEPPARIEVWQLTGSRKDVRGEMIHHEDFRPDNKLDIERANRLANEIMATAQHDCDSIRKESWYQIAIIDLNRKANPLVRRVGPLQPKRSYAMKTLNSGNGEDDNDDEQLNVQTLAIRNIKEGNEQNRWAVQRNDRVVEGMLLLQDNIIKNQQGMIDRLVDKWFASVEKREEAEDRKVQREVLLEREKFKLGLMKEGMRTARNLLPGLFGGNEAPQSSAPSPSLSNGNGHAIAEAKDHGHSPERVLVGNFLHDIDEAGEEVGVKLFGNFEERDGKIVQTSQGIFAVKQYSTLIGIRDGRMPASAIDNLLPGSGHELAITQDQIIKAGEAGVTEGIGMAILELVGLRKRAKEAALNAPPSSTPPQNSPSL